MSDELLIVRCRLGERDAFAELVRSWHDPVRTYVVRMLGPDRADDVTQEVWLAVFRGLPRLRDPGSFPAWLFTIARRAVADLLRAEYARPEPVEEAEAAGPDDAGPVVDRHALAGHLAVLPAREREVLILHYLEDLPVDTCAQICAVPAGTIKSRLNRARHLLRAELVSKGYRDDA